MMSLIPKPIKTNNKDVKQFSYVKNRIDRAPGKNATKVFKVHYSVPFMHETEMLRSSQYFYERMKLRRSVRHFSSKSVPMKIVQNIIKIAGCSPSVGNTQPWKFCVVMDEKRKAEIRAIVEADARANYIRQFIRTGDGSEWVMGVSQMQETWRRPYLTDAPLLLVVCHEP
ncbi:nitroreductase family protein [Dictyocaulus viviparus]|uniref:Nitroreductase family protein n=1 Tax=Dictyocaulus viviparus TaxID=29172 RepID=A0A0D8XWW7_DICVI|nr:nitroreductase family protein [Dictyocaulus viviparus]